MVVDEKNLEETEKYVGIMYLMHGIQAGQEHLFFTATTGTFSFTLDT